MPPQERGRNKITSPHDIADHYVNISKDLLRKVRQGNTKIGKKEDRERKTAIKQQKNTTPREDITPLKMKKKTTTRTTC